MVHLPDDQELTSNEFCELIKKIEKVSQLDVSYFEKYDNLIKILDKANYMVLSSEATITSHICKFVAVMKEAILNIYRASEQSERIDNEFARQSMCSTADYFAITVNDWVFHYDSAKGVLAEEIKLIIEELISNKDFKSNSLTLSLPSKSKIKRLSTLKKEELDSSSNWLPSYFDISKIKDCCAYEIYSSYMEIIKTSSKFCVNVRSNNPIPLKQALFYFEVLIHTAIDDEMYVLFFI